MVVLLGLGSLALGPLPPAPCGRRRGRTRLVAGLMVAAIAATAAAPAARAAAPPDPLFAYYYIWFNAGSWNRARRTTR